jgi:chromosome segregation ATPase
MSERERLETHVDQCELRYRQLDDRMTRVEQRIDDVTEELKSVKAEMNSGFGEIKTMLTDAKDEKFKTVVMTAGSIIVGLLGLLGYLITHLK